MASPVITAAERRARLVQRHRLGPSGRADDPVQVAGDLVGLHGTDPASVYLSLWARLRSPSFPDIDSALYADRRLVRILGMRRTMFVLPVPLAGIVQESTSRTVAATERRKLLGWLAADPGVPGDGVEWLASMSDAALVALAEGGLTAAELRAAEPRLGAKFTPANGGPAQNIGPRVLFLLGADGLVLRGRPRGTWLSSTYEWWLTSGWLGAPLPDVPPDAAREALVRAWLAAYGPATVADLKWWTGWNLKPVRAALDAVGAVPVSLDGEPGVALPSDLEPVGPVEPCAALLPALDPTIMGWQERSFYLGEHRAALFDRNGNAGPSVWWDGRVIGGWAQLPTGEVTYRLLADAGAEAAEAVSARAAELTAWLTPHTPVPRFRTPLETSLRT